jgi:hypothetical protein
VILVLSARAGGGFVVPSGTIATKSASWLAKVAGGEANETEGLFLNGRSEWH